MSSGTPPCCRPACTPRSTWRSDWPGTDSENPRLVRVDGLLLRLTRQYDSERAGDSRSFLDVMICDPPEQSAGQISEAIGASRASLTTNIRVLMTMGFVVKRTKPGQRTAYFRLEDGTWERVIRRQVGALGAFREIADDGLALIGRDGARAARVREAYEMFEWMMKVFDNAPPPPSRQEGRK